MPMHQRWTLHVEQFARFQQADIELRPLTLFVGENNSGKSYMATLLWGLLALGRTVFPTATPTTKASKTCQSRLMGLMGAAVQKLHQGSRQPEVVLSTQDQQCFIDWFNELLQQNRNKLAARLFGDDAITMRRLSLDNYHRHKPLRINQAIISTPARIRARADHYMRHPAREVEDLLMGYD